MAGKIEFVLLVDGQKHKTRKVTLNSPVQLLRQPDRSWVVLMPNAKDMESADIIRKMGSEFGITPLDDEAHVTIKLDESNIGRLAKDNMKRLVSNRTSVLIALSGR